MIASCSLALRVAFTHPCPTPSCSAQPSVRPYAVTVDPRAPSCSARMTAVMASATPIRRSTPPPGTAPPALRCVAPPARHFTVTAESFSEIKSFPRAKWRAVALGCTSILSTKAAVECTSQAIWLLHSPKRDRKRFSRSTGAATSAASESSAPLHRCGDDGGRARRRALCTRWTRLMSQASPRAAKHARTHEYLMHHTAWTACSPHVLAGRSKAVELT